MFGCILVGAKTEEMIKGLEKLVMPDIVHCSGEMLQVIPPTTYVGTSVVQEIRGSDSDKLWGCSSARCSTRCQASTT